MKILTISALLLLAFGSSSAAPAGTVQDGDKMAVFEEKGFANTLHHNRMKRSISDSQISQFTPFEDDITDDSRNRRSPDENTDTTTPKPMKGRAFFNGKPIGVSQLCDGCGIVNPYAGGTYIGK
ncbi:uncharacterized protein LOC110859772 [Folsomia candida]|uniref:Uncharacterized protein n=1 Tax=Folsomia candida TaxID=158441 RepID=A0A226D9K0_FOLCA|nr:uncharacterized protein LOC110859772 [Folsomia candida]OXA41820.1 hypothetical protein Fcan01_23370 [Folsomia candida]